jgi:hypothetical protein
MIFNSISILALIESYTCSRARASCFLSSTLVSFLTLGFFSAEGLGGEGARLGGDGDLGLGSSLVTIAATFLAFYVLARALAAASA